MTIVSARHRRSAFAASLAAALAVSAGLAAATEAAFDAITLPALDECVAQLADGAEEEARACLEPMMAICVRSRAVGDAPEALRACIEAETQAWLPLIDAHFEQIEAKDDVKELTRNEMMRTIAVDVLESRCPQLSEDGVSDAFCELRTTGSLAIDLRLDLARQAAEAQ
ncbi:MAG: hypothetical protein AAF763_01475 [Pseudomonadota bacterium]